MAYQMFHDALIKGPDVSLSASQLKNLPYAASYARLGDEPRAMVVLARVKGDERIWVSRDHEYLFTRHGRLVRTDGLKKANLKRLHFDGGDPLASGLGGLAKVHYQSKGTIDLMPDYRYGLPFIAHYKIVGHSRIVIANRSMLLTQVDETFAIPDMNYRIVNHYWMDNKGLIWKSIQRPIPSLPAITLTLIKPYQQDIH
ncbi:MAG: putative lipoprotein GfcB [Candidatus Celerinatantimonas neptuna]|nr:MAG: putative lipoprotein GfcB [Candidatus Celerinatantimonas neptuna]